MKSATLRHIMPSFTATALAASCAVLEASPSLLVSAFVAPPSSRGLSTAAGPVSNAAVASTTTVGRRSHVLMR